MNLIGIATESEEVTVATGTETATEVTDMEKSLHITEVPIAMAAAETMVHRLAEATTGVQAEETMALQAEEEIIVPAVEITVRVGHTARTLILHRAIESLGMIAEEAGQVDSMDQEGEEILGVEGMEDETENEVFRQRDPEVQRQI